MVDTLYQIVEVSLPSSGNDAILCVAIALIPSPHVASGSPSLPCSITTTIRRLKWTSDRHFRCRFLLLPQEYRGLPRAGRDRSNSSPLPAKAIDTSRRNSCCLGVGMLMCRRATLLTAASLRRLKWVHDNV